MKLEPSNFVIPGSTCCRSIGLRSVSRLQPGWWPLIRLWAVGMIAVLLGGPVQAKLTGPAERHLGPTGLYGEIGANRIRITQVARGAPADGKIKDGMDFAFDSLESESGKGGFKVRMLLEVLPKYGANAQAYLPKIKALAAGKFQPQWDAMIRAIETSTNRDTLMTFEEANRPG